MAIVQSRQEKEITFSLKIAQVNLNIQVAFWRDGP